MIRVMINMYEKISAKINVSLRMEIVEQKKIIIVYSPTHTYTYTHRQLPSPYLFLSLSPLPATH